MNEEIKEEVETEGVGKVRKTCSTCEKRVYVLPSRLTCPVCHTPFATRKVVVRAKVKAEKETVKAQKKAEKKAKGPRKVKEVPADLLKKVATVYPSELKSSTSIIRKLSLSAERKMVQRAMRAIDRAEEK